MNNDNNNINLTITNAANSGGNGFYFSNSSLVGAGTTEFNRKWGQRKNTDFWRVAAKARELSEIQSNNAANESSAAIDTIKNNMPLATKASAEMKKNVGANTFHRCCKESGHQQNL